MNICNRKIAAPPLLQDRLHHYSYKVLLLNLLPSHCLFYTHQTVPTPVLHWHLIHRAYILQSGASVPDPESLHSPVWCLCP
ncbi:hypothetical protein XELAEV_18002670mg [Xenopus laevis]|uniref:Uncharacterized protein n=1 Tax=Xenopus laevis TaxID=8355 RepID=A0A974BNF1_XENLA|nr:hypothetical protein XELAEV_18002670mg [Xenopus laevis]